MAAIDYERVVLRLKEHICSKRSHGQDELLRTLTELEVENELEGDGFDARPRPRRVEPSDVRPAAAGRT